MQIKRIKVRNFKKHKKFEAGFSPFSCVVGPDGSGKTSILESLLLYEFCLRSCLEEKRGSFGLRRKVIETADFSGPSFGNPLDLWTDRKAWIDDAMVPLQVEVTYDDMTIVRAKVEPGRDKFSVSVSSIPNADDTLRRLDKWTLTHVPFLSSIPAREERRNDEAVNREIGAGRNYLVVRNLLLEIKFQGLHKKLEGILKAQYPDLSSFTITYDEANEQQIQVIYREKGRDCDFDLFSGSSGFIQMVHTYSSILLKQPATLMLDSIDSHFHSSRHREVFKHLRRAVGGATQIIIATHSRDLVSKVEEGGLINLGFEEAIVNPSKVQEEEKPKHKPKPKEEKPVLETVIPSNLAIVKETSRMLFVRDAEAYGILSVMCEKCIGIERWTKARARLAVGYTKESPWMANVELLCGQVEQLAELEEGSLRSLVVADLDFCPDRTWLLERLTSDHVEWHLLKRVTMQNYILHPGAIGKAIGIERKGKLVEEDFLAEFSRAMNDSATAAEERLIDAFERIARDRKESRTALEHLRHAREHLDKVWAKEKLDIVDGRDNVLPALRKWMKSQGLIEANAAEISAQLRPQDIPDEFYRLSERVARFAEV